VVIVVKDVVKDVVDDDDCDDGEGDSIEENLVLDEANVVVVVREPEVDEIEVVDDDSVVDETGGGVVAVELKNISHDNR
jgi:hypothetical protein